MKTSLRILNVEDCVADAELNAAMICARWPRSEFTRVDNRADLIDALEAKKFDLILSDYTIPSFDGREALSVAHEMSPETPFLFVSGTIGEDVAIEALKNGATDYVLKHRLMRLIPAIDRALRETSDRAEREHAEHAMRESEHKYREVFECLDEAAFLADEETGKIIDTNRSAEKILGCERAQILGHKQSEFLNVPDSVATADSGSFDSMLTCLNGRALAVKGHMRKLMIYGHALVLTLYREHSAQ
jgi:PAS domain-containing protein